MDKSLLDEEAAYHVAHLPGERWSRHQSPFPAPLSGRFACVEEKTANWV